GGGEAGERRVGDHLDELFAAAGAFFDFFALRASTLIVPEERSANDSVLFVEEDRAVHLAGEADAFDVGRLQLRAFHDGADGADRGLPPVFRILLAPEWLGGVERILGRRFGKHFAFFVDGDGL